MVGYLRTGSLQVKQRFTNDLEKGCEGVATAEWFRESGPYNPYVEVIEALKRFESQPLWSQSDIACFGWFGYFAWS